MIKAIFHDKHDKCLIPKRSEYNLGNIKSPEIYSVDCLFQYYPNRGGKRCDDFVFSDLSRNKTGLYLIEKKTNSQDIKEVIKQLQGGANFIEAFLDGDPATDAQPFDFMPVWIFKFKPSQRPRLRSAKISLRGIKKPVRRVENGKALPKMTKG